MSDGLKKDMIKKYNFLTIVGWMITELDLKGTDLMVYAIIYGFSQTEGQMFTGSAMYIAQWANVSRRAIMESLKRLLELDLIVKEEEFKNNVKFCKYYVNRKFIPDEETSLGDMKNVHRGYEECSQGGMNNVHNGYEENSHNNIDNNIDNKKEDILLSLFEKLWSVYPKKYSKKPAFKSFKKAIQSGVKFEDIEKGVIKYADQCRRMKTDTQYIKHFSTFLNQECWNDEYGPVNYQEDYSREANILDEIDFTKL